MHLAVYIPPAVRWLVKGEISVESCFRGRVRIALCHFGLIRNTQVLFPKRVKRVYYRGCPNEPDGYYLHMSQQKGVKT
jgi:hypothetical protein